VRKPAAEAAPHADAIRAFVKAAPVAVAMTDRQLRFLAISATWFDDMAVSEAEILGRSSYEVAPETLEFRPEHKRALSGETVCGKPKRLILPNGSERWMNWQASPWRDERGRIGGLLIVSHNVTAQIEAENEARRQRAFASTILEHSPLPLVVKDEHGRVLMMNRAMEELLAIRTKDYRGRAVAEFVSPELARRVAEEDRAVLASDEPLITEEINELPGREGQRIMRKTKVAVRDGMGPPYLLTIYDDVTDRRRQQEELERTRAFLSTVIENVPVGLTVKDAADGRLLISNRAAARLFGLDFGVNRVGRRHDEVFPPELAARFSAQDAEVVATGEPRLFEEQPIPGPEGVRYLNQRKVLVRNADGQDYLLSISEDVTERRETQDALKEAVARAEAANVSKSEFLANMSHEIRTPLNGVLGLADALSRMELTPKQAEIVRMIVGSGKALTAILSDVLDLAKAESGQLTLTDEPFSLHETISSSAFLFETVARDKGLDFKVGFDISGPDALVGDPLRIKQIVSNLISNAVKFTSKGEVAITARCVQAMDGAAEIEIRVRDSGPGFSEEVRKRLFGRFEQGDGSITRQFGGAGLGLSIARTLARMMDGEIDCSAKPGKGAEFVFRARLKPDHAARSRAEPEADTPSAAGGRRLRILLAEDHVVNQKVIQLMLEGAAELMIVGNGQAAVDAALSGEGFDLVLMDTQMPVMDGLSAIRAIREAEAKGGGRRTPIISLTANAMSHQVQAAMQAGADLHLAKPITSESLHGAISQALEAAADRAAA
jgi:PAS domain S-box-containing protein